MIVTVAPVERSAPAAGVLLDHEPVLVGRVDGRSSPTWTLKPASSQRLRASSSVSPPTSGTSTCGGALATVSVTVRALVDVVPAAGSCASTVPPACVVDSCSVDVGRSPAARSALRASALVLPTTTGHR